MPGEPLTTTTTAPVRSPAGLRVLVVTESFLPQVNGVTNSVCRVLEHLQRRGHRAAVVAPTGPASYADAPVHRVPAVALPGYRSLRVGLPVSRRLVKLMQRLAPDVVHIASPTVLGAAAARAAHALGIPAVAVYQTDLQGFARKYRMGGAVPVIERHVRRTHELCQATLAPSSASMAQLAELGVPRVQFWPRGIDTGLFTPARRQPELYADLAPARPGPPVTVGYVGRLAKEKDLHHLSALHDLPGVRLVLIGEGPEEHALRRQLPQAHFLGAMSGQRLAAHLASLDVFVHTGAEETFCQAVQEASASRVPTVGPAAGGLLDRIEHGVTGMHYTVGDTGGLRRAVQQLAESPSRRTTMGAAAQRNIQGRSWAAVGDQLLETFHEVVGTEAAVTPHAGLLNAPHAA